MEVKELLPIGIAFVIVAIALSVGTDVLVSVHDEYAVENVTETPWNVSGKGITGMTKVSNWLPTIGIVLGASVVIGTLITYFATGR